MVVDYEVIGIDCAKDGSYMALVLFKSFPMKHIPANLEPNKVIRIGGIDMVHVTCGFED